MHRIESALRVRGKNAGRIACGVMLSAAAAVGALRDAGLPQRSGSSSPTASPSAYSSLGQRLQGADTLDAAEDLFAPFVVDCIRADRHEEGRAVLQQFIVSRYHSGSRLLERRKMQALSSGADGIAVLEWLGDVRWDDEVLRWIAGSNEGLRRLADVLHPEDDHVKMVKIIHALYEHDPDGRDRFLKLIIAMAIVWDQPRPLLHQQMGPIPLVFDECITDRYDLFRDIYASYSGRVMYDNLDVAALRFVVDTPVPVGELRWARANVKGSAGSWDRKFSDIPYDGARLEREIYSWPHGAYSLAAIEEKGGLCIDQAYYATISARANGIPAIFFLGEGRRGSHAWFAYLGGRSGWKLDVGRYVYDRYATGHARNPQTNRWMTDHDVEYACDASLNSRQFSEARARARVALVLLDGGDFEAAAACARSARELVKTYALPWSIEIAALEQMGQLRAAVELLDDKAGYFERYPDIETGARQRQAALLRRLGDDDAAGRVMHEQLRRLEDTRDDLASEVLVKQAHEAARAGNLDDAREILEELLEDRIREGYKLVPLTQRYLALTKATQQTGEAVRFMEQLTRQTLQIYGAEKKNARIFLSLLRQAYVNDENEDGIRDTQRRLDRL